MDDRYEIRGKLGQGGIGTVYRAFDQRMNREVAIKRIIPESGGNQDKATRQLTQEAGALAALQHPHIVTVYDVGLDEDGPYVVMELLTGKTLDEVIESGAPLTFQDFRELALQSQEALIAAQELSMVHRDLKPGNVMLNWLPSGKFQVKIVDFGLAKFTPKPSLQTLDHGDSVFGSIYFMSPEQFERVPIDARTDMYAIGCVYYFSLTGKYPFDGENGPQVMAAHLSHRVIPLGELRPDLPRWVCDWVMWHINRQQDDRPTNAREALEIFLRNDNQATSSVAIAAPVRRAVPAHAGAAAPHHPSSATAPQPLLPPNGSKPSVHTGTQAVPVQANPTGPMTHRAAMTHGATTSPTVAGAHPRKKQALGNKQKIIIGAAAAVVAIVGGIAYVNHSNSEKQAQTIQTLSQKASDPSVTELPVSGGQLKLLMDALTQKRPASEQQALTRALRVAKASDSTNVDLKLAEFVTSAPLDPKLRASLFADVIRKREQNAGAALIAEYARTTNDEQPAEAALRALWPSAGDTEFDSLLETIMNRKSPALREAAKSTALEVIKRSSNRSLLLASLDKAIERAKDEVRATLLDLKLSVPHI